MSLEWISKGMLLNLLEQYYKTQQSEVAQLITYPGWSELTKNLKVTSPEDAISQASSSVKQAWEDLTKPHSPLTPEDAVKYGLTFADTISNAYRQLIAAITSLEVTGFGQIETPAYMLPSSPDLRSAIAAAEAFYKAYLDATFVKGVQYSANALHQPTILPENILLDLYCKGLISKETFQGQMMYHGYTTARSELYGASGFRWPDPSTIITMLRRGYLTEKGAVDWLKMNRFPEETAKGLLKLAEEVPEPYRLADFAAKRLIPDETLYYGFKWHGISKEFAEAWKHSQYRLESPADAMEMVWRGIIDKETFGKILEKAGYDPGTIDRYKQMMEQIPPASDLITMVVREAFVPEWVTPAPEVFAKYMAMKGYTREWADRYWTAHWVRMPLTQAYACYYRGIWDEDRLRTELKYHDYHPYLIDDMVKVAYGIPSLRELGYGYDVGVYTKEDIERYRRWAGLSPEDAKKATEALVAYRTEAERNAVRTELLYAFGRGKLTLEELEAKLREVKTPEDAIPLWLERAQLYKDRITKEPALPEQRIIGASEALSAFKLGLRDENWLRSRLKDLNWTDDRIDLAIELARARLEDEVIISASEAIDAFKKGLRDEQWLRKQLKALRWNDEKIQLAIERATWEKPKEPKYKLLTMSEMRKLYLMGKIDYKFIVDTFIAMGYREDDAKLLADLTTYVEPPVEEPKALPTSAAEDLYYYMIFDEEDLYNNYRLQGYSDESAWLLVMRTVLNQEYPTLKKMYGEGAINDKQLYDALFRIVADDWTAKQLVQKIKYELAVARLGKEKDLTKSEIIKGVKSGVISYAQGIELLTDIGYSEEEADYLLKINKVVAAGDPESYLEMKQVTEAFKKARGEPAVEIPEEAIAIELQIKEVRRQLEEARKHPEEEEKIKELALKLADLEARLRTVLAKSVRK